MATHDTGIALERRTFLAHGGALLLAAMAPAQADAALTRLNRSSHLFAAAWMDDDRQPGVALLDANGALLWQETLPARGHGFARRPDGRQGVVFARRPGRFGLAFPLGEAATPQVFDSTGGRHFYGHGVYSADGRLLYTTENDIDGERGVIGVRDVQSGFRHIGEFDCHGIGPHDIALSPDGNRLIVANGGILTHPDSGRQKLNLATMRPGIVVIDAQTGDLVSRHELPSRWHRLSLRHMACDELGGIWIGGQYEGDPADAAPLIAHLPIDAELTPIALPDTWLPTLAGYIGSVAFDRRSQRVACTAPKGNCIVLLDGTTGAPLELLEQPATCAIAAADGAFVTASEQGLAGSQQHAWHWDNHMRRM